MGATPDDLETAQAILHRYGFRTGALEDELSGQQLTVDQKSARLRGRGEASISYSQASAGAFLATGADELNERYALFSAPDGGSITRSANGLDRTIRFSFDPDSGRLGQAVGVSFDESKAKVNWRVYQAMIDAAFATPGLNSVDMGGGWRPTYAFFNAYFKQSASLGVMSAAAREQARISALQQAHMPDHKWSLVHTRGQGVDITRVNGVAVNRPVTFAGYAMAQPEVLRQFSFNLRHEPGTTQVIQPWMTFGCNVNTLIRANMTNQFWSNIAGLPGAKPVETGHRNHIHLTVH